MDVRRGTGIWRCSIWEIHLLIDRAYNTMGMPKQQFVVRELWTNRVLDTSLGPTARRIYETLPPHGALLLELRR